MTAGEFSVHPVVKNTTDWNNIIRSISNDRQYKGHQIIIDGDVAVQGTSYNSWTFGRNAISILITGSGRLRLSNPGALITLNGQTLVIDAPALALEGLGSGRNNNQPLFVVENRGKLDLRNGTIRGNSIQGGNIGNGGGVFVGNQSSFVMSGGTITGNAAARSGNAGNGGGVYVQGNFTMTGGTITGNTANQGGGVYVSSSGTFSRNNGTVTGNNPDNIYQ